MSASEPIHPVSLSGSVVSVKVGTIAPLGPRKVPSAFVKRPVTGAVMAKPLGLVADPQADLHVHGGPDKAIDCYPIEHYAKWLEWKERLPPIEGSPQERRMRLKQAVVDGYRKYLERPCAVPNCPCIIHRLGMPQPDVVAEVIHSRPRLPTDGGCPPISPWRQPGSELIGPPRASARAPSGNGAPGRSCVASAPPVPSTDRQ